MRLEGEESQTHVGEDEVLCQEVQQLKQLMEKRETNNCMKTDDGKTHESDPTHQKHSAVLRRPVHRHVVVSCDTVWCHGKCYVAPASFQ